MPSGRGVAGWTKGGIHPPAVRLPHPAVPYFCTLSFVLGYERRKEGGFFMQTGNGKTSLELNILHGLCAMEEIAEKKAKIYARLLIEPSLTSEMEKLSQMSMILLLLFQKSEIFCL